MEDWRRYEERVYQKLRSEFPDHDIEPDVRVRGRMSGIDRKVDVAIRRQVGGYDVFGAVECRKLSRRLDVTAVDRFAGFLQDIGADFGIMFAPKGYSGAAHRRAAHAHIKLDIVDYREIDEYRFVWKVCQMCELGPDRPPPPIDFEPSVEIIRDGIASMLEIGRCNYCGGIHVKCGACGGITPVWESEYNSPMECWGGCGVRFMLRSEHVEKGLFEEWVEFIAL